jgi:tetratricopeptide (TPR) repeat protein
MFLGSFSYLFTCLELENIETLKIELEQAPDAAKSFILNKLSKAFWKDKNKFFIYKYASESLGYAKKYNQKEQIFLAHYNIGNYYRKIKNYQKSLKYAHKCLKLANKRQKNNEILDSLELFRRIYAIQKNYIEEINILKRTCLINSIIGSKENVAQDTHTISTLYYLMGDIQNCQKYTIKAKNLYIEIGDKFRVIQMLTYMAVHYQKFKNYKQANKCLIEAEKIVDNNEIKEKERAICRLYHGFGRLYKLMQNYEEAIKYLKEGLLIAETITNSYSKSHWKSTIVNCLGDVYIKINKYDTALKYFNKSLEIKFNKERYTEYYSIEGLKNIGVVNLKKKEFNQALSFFNKSLELSKIHNETIYQMSLYKFIGKTYSNKNDINNAIIHLKEGIKVFKNHNKDKVVIDNREIRENYKLLSDIYNKLGKVKQSKKYLKIASNLKDFDFPK